MEPNFKEGDKVLVYTLNFNNLKGPKKMRELFGTPSLSSEFRKAILSDRGGQIPLQEEELHPPEIVEVEDSPGPVKKIITARKIRLNGKDQRQYLVRFKDQAADKETWLAEDVIPDRNLHLKRFSSSRRTGKSHR
ncbi:hypothetical protein O181_003157 [Austropuccinia psidii MF-1]|uniref:Chromo domain-containing protein n=1 Tax=Austropuccinia psidii MF-1 TaxID=1389203 RepID=A0A9Q3BE73_9BASI|nr:hypothetical protein [Austropuccinia psidii MF-1]